MLLACSVLNTESLNAGQFSLRRNRARSVAPKAPRAAASVGSTNPE